MLQNTGEDLDALIDEEKKRVAIEFFSEAWANAISEGIEAGILADSAVQTAIMRLVEMEGEHRAEELIESLQQRLECGDFLEHRTMQ